MRREDCSLAAPTCSREVMLLMEWLVPSLEAPAVPSSVLSCSSAYRIISSGDSASRSSLSSLMFIVDFSTFGVESRSFFLLSL